MTQRQGDNLPVGSRPDTRIRDRQLEWKRVQPTVTAGAYSTNDVIGARLQFKGLGQCALDTVSIVDEAAQSADYLLVFFKATPTDITDNATFDIADADMDNIIYRLPVPAATYRQAFTDNCIYLVDGLTKRLFSDEPDGSVWAFLIATASAPTYVATTDVRVSLGFVKI